MNADNDRALVVPHDGSDPAALARLRKLVDARTGKPADGSATYRGIPIPDRVRKDRDENRPYSALFNAWRGGVDAAFSSLTGLIADFLDGAECSLDHHGYCQEHGWFDTAPCPHDRARKLIDTEEGAEG